MKHKFALLFFLSITQLIFSTDWYDTYVLTDKIVVIHFKDGFINYNGYRQDESKTNITNDPLNVDLATSTSTYLITSDDDVVYAQGINPIKVGRKSKGAYFSNQCIWQNSICDNEVVNEHYIYLVLDKSLKKDKTYKIQIDAQLSKNYQTQTISFKNNKLRSEAIHINQIGFLPNASKKFAYLSHWMGDLGPLQLDDYKDAAFKIINIDNNSIEFQGTISKRLDINNSTNLDLPRSPDQGYISMSDVWECDFSSFKKEGQYILVVEGLGASYPFEIKENIYKELYYLTTKQLYHQRAGIALENSYTEWTRPRNLHPDDGKIKFKYTSSVWTDWKGRDRENGVEETVLAAIDDSFSIKTWGWYMDAGDWDGYYNHTKVPRYLMTAYELAPENFVDGDLNLPESGNNIPDILDEAQWLLNYLHRTRGPSGGIAGVRVHPDFETKENKFIPSWEDTRTWLISGEDPVTTYTFAGMAAHFSYCLKITNHKDYLLWAQRAEEAYKWASENEALANGDFVNGRLYAAAQMYKLTGNKNYELQYIEDRALPETRNESHYNLEFADWSYLTTNHADRNINFWNTVLNDNLQKVSNNLVKTANSRSFRVGWASNFRTFLGQATTPQIFPALVLYKITDNKAMLEASLTSVDYVLGGNPLDMCWVVGVGDKSPEQLLHLDTWYHPENRSDFYIPGSIPYGPTDYGLGWPPKNGPWSSEFAWDRVYPSYKLWPLHEGFFNNKLAVPTNEYTIHQTTAPAAAVFGLLSGVAASKIEVNKRPTIDLEIDDTTNDKILLKSNASDSDGFITKVLFFSNGHKIGEVTSSPFVYQLKDFDKNSNYTAVAIDNKGAKSRSKKKVVLSEKIEVEARTIFLDVGETLTVNATILPNDVTVPGLYWQSLDLAIAKADEGKITGISEGKTSVLISSIDGNITQKIDVFVGDLDEIKVYPNPILDGKLQIISHQKPAKAIIWSFSGKKVAAFNLENKKEIIDVTTLQNGIYIIQITDTIQTKNYKIIVGN